MELWGFKTATFEIGSKIFLELNAAKNTDFIKKCVKKLFGFKFSSKNSVGAYLYVHLGSYKRRPAVVGNVVHQHEFRL